MKYSLNGIIYKLFIDPILSRYYHHIIEELDLNDKVLDVACGTGSLSLAMSGVVYSVSGIDLSEEMIYIARDSAVKKNVSNAAFILMDASELSSYHENEFDIAVASMAVHQFDSALALKILGEMKRIAAKVIIMDYNYPIRSVISRTVIFIIERIAGGDHYSNFRRFNGSDGLGYFIEHSGLRYKYDKLKKTSAFRIVVCS